jgi:hypothetical protein
MPLASYLTVADLLNAIKYAFGTDDLDAEEVSLLARTPQYTLARLQEGYDQETESPWPPLGPHEFRPLLRAAIDAVDRSAVSTWAIGDPSPLKEGLTRYSLVAHSVAMSDPIVYMADFGDLPLTDKYLSRIFPPC